MTEHDWKAVRKLSTGVYQWECTRCGVDTQSRDKPVKVLGVHHQGMLIGDGFTITESDGHPWTHHLEIDCDLELVRSIMES
jgi:hypothetical protein